jgi:hypothetical protein
MLHRREGVVPSWLWRVMGRGGAGNRGRLHAGLAAAPELHGGDDEFVEANERSIPLLDLSRLSNRRQCVEASDGVPMSGLVVAESLFELRAEVAVGHSQVSPAGSEEDELEHGRIAAQASEKFVH